MKVNLDIALNRVEGALVRVLGTIERRGHRVLNMNYEPARFKAVTTQNLQMTVDCGDRSAEVLIRQLNRLWDVDLVEFRFFTADEKENEYVSSQTAPPALANRVVPAKQRRLIYV